LLFPFSVWWCKSAVWIHALGMPLWGTGIIQGNPCYWLFLVCLIRGLEWKQMSVMYKGGGFHFCSRPSANSWQMLQGFRCNPLQTGIHCIMICWFPFGLASEILTLLLTWMVNRPW
jgi:hypothetical protein